MREERHTPTEDFTPLPMSVRQGPDSNPGLAVDADQSREAGQGREVTKYRSGLKNALVFSGALVTAFMAPEAANSVHNARLAETRAAIAKVAEKPNAIALKSAQVDAARQLFPRVNNGPNTSGTNIEAAQKVANTHGDWKRLDPEKYLPEGVEISEDGKTFTAEGQAYGLNRIVSEEGGEYIIAGKRHEKYIVDPVLVGGARNDLSSDINEDGKTEPWEVRQLSDQSARVNLTKGFKPPEKIIVGSESARVQIEPGTFVAKN